jgi:hypothetical protein
MGKLTGIVGGCMAVALLTGTAAIAAAAPAVNRAAAYQGGAVATHAEQLFRCRFGQPGRGSRILMLPATNPAIAGCLARARSAG